MGLMFFKNLALLFLLISASLLSSSSAGRLPRVAGNSGKELSEVHERLLKDNTRDYGRYDPAPALVKPPFKLIPN